MPTLEEMMANPRWFIDRAGVYQSNYEGSRKQAHVSWVKLNSWGLTRDDFIRLSYFNGNIENGSDGKYPINGSGNEPYDVVYVSGSGREMFRTDVSYWLNDYLSYAQGYINALKELEGNNDGHCINCTPEGLCNTGPQCVTLGLDSKACTECGPYGIEAMDGTGPYDCYACGKKASKINKENNNEHS